MADELEDVYAGLVARRHDDPRQRPDPRTRLRERRLIDVDLHMHTDHSYDCATPVEVLLAEARARGLGAIAITDHNEISGAHAAREPRPTGSTVIVGEEVKTADQGEVIGLFIEEKIPRGMTLQETIAEIKRQGGLVYVPAPVRPHALGPRLRAPARRARRRRRDRGVQPARGDHRVQRRGGPVRGQVPDPGRRRLGRPRAPGPRLGADPDARVRRAARSSCESLRDADIVRNPASLLYVQALKFLQTKALPESARRASRDRRVRRATGRDRRRTTRDRRKS